MPPVTAARCTTSSLCRGNLSGPRRGGGLVSPSGHSAAAAGRFAHFLHFSNRCYATKKDRTNSSVKTNTPAAHERVQPCAAT